LNDLLDLCEEYFEMSIGVRKPTDTESDRAAELTMKLMTGGIDWTPERSVEILKRPVRNRPLLYTLKSLSKIEYSIYVLISNYLDTVDGPYIPMIRYERLIQRDLISENDFSAALIRQIALFQTYFRLKTSIERKYWSEKLGWKQSLNCAYRGEKLFGKIIYENLCEIWNIRCNYAHEWRIYLEETPEPLKEAYVKGIRIMAKFLDDELDSAYNQYTKNPFSERLPSHWMRRDASSIEASPARVRIAGITCEHCGEQFDPHTSYTDCPYYGAKHDFLDRF
jgi:ribosomal protein L32